jgi:hypothetical protein
MGLMIANKLKEKKQIPKKFQIPTNSSITHLLLLINKRHFFLILIRIDFVGGFGKFFFAHFGA